MVFYIAQCCSINKWKKSSCMIQIINDLHMLDCRSIFNFDIMMEHSEYFAIVLLAELFGIPG